MKNRRLFASVIAIVFFSQTPLANSECVAPSYEKELPGGITVCCEQEENGEACIDRPRPTGECTAGEVRVLNEYFVSEEAECSSATCQGEESKSSYRPLVETSRITYRCLDNEMYPLPDGNAILLLDGWHPYCFEIYRADTYCFEDRVSCSVSTGRTVLNYSIPRNYLHTEHFHAFEGLCVERDFA